ncbi:unnamed protein product [Nippostrongylus brasiliensis]|uniref:Rho-GAP domain-containing protein n=1 Tax=Nippostrongylus brasiliensis TaxID=27835 RepID=A0A158R2N5_NIPBR|nr:unnamed protein product [Nippostrongylus brasiliensis]
MKNLLERSCAIATGLSVLVDHLLVKVPALKSDILQTSAHIQHLTAMKVPDDTVLSHLNMTNRWAIQESPPFKQMDLKALMANWRMPARAKKDDHIIQCVDFVRFYLSRACDPVEEISRYAVRVSGKHAKGPTKADLPDGIVDTLIKCLLDGLRMGQPELDRMPEELMSNPTQFWTEMGDTDQARSSNLKERQALRDAWKGALRGVLGRAL